MCNVRPTIITLGNGGYNIAGDMIAAGLFSDFKLIVCDTDAEDLKRNSANADCSFLLDRSIDRCHSVSFCHVEPIIKEITDVYYLVAALGGRTSAVFAPAIANNAERGFFSWHILTTPADFEGDTVRERARITGKHLLSAGDMKLIQDNNQLSTIPDLVFGEMNRPIVDTLVSVSNIDIKGSIQFTESYDELIPEQYRNLISLYRNIFRYPTIL